MIENVFYGAANMRRMRKIKFGTMVLSESLIISLGGLGGLWKGGKNMDNQNKELYFAKTVIGAIENVKVPMLMYEEEKEVVKKALQMYINKIEMDARCK